MSLVRDLQELFEFFKRRAALRQRLLFALFNSERVSQGNRGFGLEKSVLIDQTLKFSLSGVRYLIDNLERLFIKLRARDYFLLTYFGKAALKKPNNLIKTTDAFDCLSFSSQCQSEFLQSFSVKTQKTLKPCIVPAQLAF